jgi:hypothetical protein
VPCRRVRVKARAGLLCGRTRPPPIPRGTGRSWQRRSGAEEDSSAAKGAPHHPVPLWRSAGPVAHGLGNFGHRGLGQRGLGTGLDTGLGHGTWTRHLHTVLGDDTCGGTWRRASPLNLHRTWDARGVRRGARRRAAVTRGGSPAATQIGFALRLGLSGGHLLRPQKARPEAVRRPVRAGADAHPPHVRARACCGCDAVKVWLRFCACVGKPRRKFGRARFGTQKLVRGIGKRRRKIVWR